MKWYNYGSKWYHITKCTRIDLDEPNMEIVFFSGEHSWYQRIRFRTRDEYNLEAEKIKEMLVVK